MNDQKKTEIKVGIIVLAAIIIFVWILGWAKNFSFSSDETTLLVKFENVSGLEIGDYVTVNGVRKGYVEGFNIKGGNVIVKLSLDEDVQLKRDAEFEITMLDLMGGKKINISPGVSSEPLDYDNIQSGIFLADIPKVMSILGSVEEEVPAIIENIKMTLQSLNSYLSDREFSSDIKSSVSNLNEASEKLNTLLDDNMGDLRKLTSNAAELSANLNEFMSNNKSSLQTSVQNLESLIKKTDVLITKVNSFTNEIKNKQNNLGKILYDDKIYEDLTKSLNQLNELTEILIKQLKTDGINVDANIF